jgi:hypothetical protein
VRPEHLIGWTNKPRQGAWVDRHIQKG